MLPPCLTGSVVIIQRNPRSGARVRRQELLRLIRTLKGLNFRPRLFSRRDKMDRWLNDPDHHRSVRCLVAAGGDGTVSNLIDRWSNLPLAILPLGTENLLAKHLGFARNGKELALGIARGFVRSMDIGRANGRVFCVTAGIGYDGEIVARVHAQRERHSSRWQYACEFLRVMWTTPAPRLRVVVDGRPMSDEYMQVFIQNAPRYALGLQWTPDARDDDGFLDACLVPPERIFQLLGSLIKLWNGWFPPWRMNIVRFREMEIHSSLSVNVQADGDPAGTTPLGVTVVAGAIRVLDMVTRR